MPLRTYAVTALKGGAGKTTSAVMLAEAAADSGAATLLIDVDRQATGSSMGWSEEAQRLGNPLRSDVMALRTRDLVRKLPTVSATMDRVFIDTPPGHPETVEAAILAADVVVVPTVASMMDISRTHATVSAARAAGKPAVVVLVRTRPVKATTSTREALEAAGLAVAVTAIPHREAITQGYGLRPGGVPLALYRELYDEIEEALQ